VPQQQFITFTIGDEEYGVDIMAIREIKGWTATTSLPETPVYVRGVINLRGAIVPIFDLRARFGGSLTEVSPRHVIIVLMTRDHLVGVLADAVADVLTVQDSDVQPVPDIEGRHDTSALHGLVAVEGRMVALLDLDRLLQNETHHVIAGKAA